MNRVTSRDGTEIAYAQNGEGPPIILVDGALNTRESGRKIELVDLLAPHFTTYIYDRRGRGESGDAPEYAVQREIDDIEALIDVAGGAANLYGHSSGGCLALDAASMLGARVTKVAVYEAPYNDDPAAQQVWRKYVAEFAEVLAAGRHGDAVSLFLQRAGIPREQIASMRQMQFWPNLEAMAPTLTYDNLIMGSTGEIPKERLAAVLSPTHLLVGGLGRAFMGDTARTISRVVPNAVVTVLPGQTHDVQPAILAPVLTEFLRS